ncbi:hypothetical protein Tco_1402670 [Tanacetum coccineum]
MIDLSGLTTLFYWTDISKRIQSHLSQIMGVPGEVEMGDMSNSDELRHTDNTTLIPPRLPDTLPQVYHRRCPTLGLLILPSVLPFPPTIKRTARMSVLPIEPNLAERARISAINLDDYQLNPVTPPPSPSSPSPMAAYQWMIAETDPTQREEALTAYGTETGQSSVLVPETVLTVCTTRLRGQLHTILEDMDRYPNSCLEELEAFLTLWDVKPRDRILVMAPEKQYERRGRSTEEVSQLIYYNNNRFYFCLLYRPQSYGNWPPADDAQMCRRKPTQTTVSIQPKQYGTSTVALTLNHNQLIATRVAEALAAAAVTHATSTQEETNLGSNSSQNKAATYKDFRAVLHERLPVY